MTTIVTVLRVVLADMVLILVLPVVTVQQAHIRNNHIKNDILQNIKNVIIEKFSKFKIKHLTQKIENTNES